MTLAEVIGDGKTVWVNDPSGCCIGRFSRFGIDVHRSGREQMAGLPECLDCAPITPGEDVWRRFTDGMRRFHSVDVSDKHQPAWSIIPALTPDSAHDR